MINSTKKTYPPPSQIRSFSRDHMAFDTMPVYSSSLCTDPSYSSSPSRSDYDTPVTGLGISSCGTERPLRFCPPEAYTTLPTAGWSERVMPSDTLQGEPAAEVGPYSSTMPYESYSGGQNEFSASPLSLYSAQTLSASPSYSWAMELGENYGVLTGQQQQLQQQQQQQQNPGFWSTTPHSDITTPPTDFVHVQDESDEYWDPALFAEKSNNPVEASMMMTMPAPQVTINGSPCPDPQLFPSDNTRQKQLVQDLDIKQEFMSASSTSSIPDASTIASDDKNSTTPPPAYPLPVLSVNTVGSGFECDICGMRFTRRSNCREHRKRHDNNKQTYACEHCTQTFGRKTDRKRHVESVSLPHLFEIIHKTER